MLSGIALLGALWSFLVPATVLAQAPGCRDPYPDNSIGSERRAQLLLENAGACVREGKPLQSIALFSELIGLDPHNAGAYLNRGNAYLQVGQLESGIADFDRAIRLKPDATEAWYNR